MYEQAKMIIFTADVMKTQISHFILFELIGWKKTHYRAVKNFWFNRCL